LFLCPFVIPFWFFFHFWLGLGSFLFVLPFPGLQSVLCLMKFTWLTLISFNLTMKCWNSVFNAQGLRVPNYSSCTARFSENICSSSEWRRSEKRKDRMKLSLPTKFVEKLVWVPVISFCKISIPKLCIWWCPSMPKLGEKFSPSNRLTLLLTLMV
jgi:hypothetical protein